MLTHSTGPTPTRGFDLKCIEFTTLMRELPDTLHRMLRATRRPFLLKEDMVLAFHRRGVAVTLEMITIAVAFQAMDYPDGKRRLAGIQVKTMFDGLGRWYDVFTFEARAAA